MEMDAKQKLEEENIKVRDPYRWASNAIAILVVAAVLVNVEYVISPPEWMAGAAIIWVFGKPVQEMLSRWVKR